MHLQEDINCKCGGCKPCWRWLGGGIPLRSIQEAGTSTCRPLGWSAPCWCSGPLLQFCSGQSPAKCSTTITNSLTYTVHMLCGSFFHLDCVFPQVQVVTSSCAPGEKLEANRALQRRFMLAHKAKRHTPQARQPSAQCRHVGVNTVVPSRCVP